MWILLNLKCVYFISILQPAVYSHAAPYAYAAHAPAHGHSYSTASFSQATHQAAPVYQAAPAYHHAAPAYH